MSGNFEEQRIVFTWVKDWGEFVLIHIAYVMQQIAERDDKNLKADCILRQFYSIH